MLLGTRRADRQLRRAWDAVFEFPLAHNGTIKSRRAICAFNSRCRPVPPRKSLRITITAKTRPPRSLVALISVAIKRSRAASNLSVRWALWGLRRVLQTDRRPEPAGPYRMGSEIDNSVEAVLRPVSSSSILRNSSILDTGSRPPSRAEQGAGQNLERVRAGCQH